MKNKIKNFMKIIINASIFAMLAFVFFPINTLADDAAEDLTETLECTSNNGVWPGAVADDNPISYWYTNKAANKYLLFESTEYIKHFYVCYIFKPSELIVQSSEDGENWEDIAYEQTDEFYHVAYTLDEPSKIIRLKCPEESTGKFGVGEVKAYSEGELPDTVQTWLPTYDDVDMLIFSAHPDDEAVFFAGLIPYYAGEKDKKVSVVYMAVSNEYRHSEVLNYLWSVHENHLPIYAGFEDVYQDQAYGYIRSIWKEQNTIDYMVSIIREKKPEVIVSHDLNGEYGHGAHMYTALCLQQAVVLAADPDYHHESLEKFGTHQTKKLYLHLYPENQIFLDILDEPLEEYGGLTAIEISKESLNHYVSQIKYQVVRVHDETSDFSCYRYGLAYTSVGYDTENNNMFENVDPLPTPTAAPTITPTPKDSATPVASPSATLIDDDTLGSGSKMNINKNLIIVICVSIVLVFIIIIMLKLYIARKKK